MRTALALALAATFTGCGARAATPAPRGPITRAEWTAVLRDWHVHGDVVDDHPCGAILVALSRLPESFPIHSTIGADLKRAESRQCKPRGTLADLRRGMSDADVAAIAGPPGRALRNCWLYRVTRGHDGRRVCFTNGRVSTLQRSVHG